MFQRLRQRNEWKFFGVLPKADRGLAVAWWLVLVLRALLPALFALAMGVLVGAVERRDALAGPLAFVGGVFVLLQVLAPLHRAIGANLGDRTAAWLYDRLTEACIRPPGMEHLEDPKLTTDLTVARDFDLGMTGPPLSISLDFIAGGLVELLGGLASVAVLFAYAWWAPLLLGGAWLSTHWLLRENAVWRDRNTDEVRSAQRDADYAFRLAVDPAPAKELRLFGLSGWILDRFVERRTLLHALQYKATRLREKPVLWSLVLLVSANVAVFWSLALAAVNGVLSLGELVLFAQSALGASLIAFGGLNWALDGSSAPVAAVLRLDQAMAPAGALPSGTSLAAGKPAREICFREVTFAYSGGPRVLDRFSLEIPAGLSLAIVGQNGAGKTTLAKLLCRLYDPQSGAIEVDGIDLREFSLESWRERVAAVFQDFIRFELSLRENVAVERAAQERGAQANRLARHLFLTATTASPGKEVRVLGLGSRLAAKRRETWERGHAPVATVRWRSALWHVLAWSVFGGAYVGAVVFVAFILRAAPGEVVLVLAAGARLSSYVGATVGEIGFLRGFWSYGARRLAWLEDYAASLRAAADRPVPAALRYGIRFEHVSFAYPGTTRLVLEDISVLLPAGSVVAVVGENGAGKTTLVKLLSKMYEPSSGTILVDDQPLNRVPVDAWRDRLSGAFQDFFRFEFRARQTVGLGDRHRLDDERAVATAVQRAGAEDVIARLAAGFDTQLGPTWPGGVELSFGQWQKLALARGFMRDDPWVVLLDEPTAALDAETEHALFERYAAAARAGRESGRITILVSHRFSTVRMADLILVLEGARLVEVGTHDELRAKRGRYAELYAIQAGAYR